MIGAVVVLIAAILGVVVLFATGYPWLAGILLVVALIAAVIYFVKRKG